MYFLSYGGKYRRFHFTFSKKLGILEDSIDNRGFSMLIQIKVPENTVERRDYGRV